MKRMNRVSCLMSHGRGFCDLLGVHVVGRDGGLADVVEQVVGQDLDRRHRQERHEDAGPEHAEHVAEVARLAPMRTYLRMLAKTLRPFEHALVQHQQDLLQQDHVGRLLGDVHGGVDADAHVGGVEGGGVVDAVAHEADDVLARLQRLDDPLLVGRRDAGEQRGLLGGLGELRRRSSSRPRCPAARSRWRARPPCRSCGPPVRCRR